MFPKNKAKKDGLSSQCRDCKAKFQHSWYLRNRVTHGKNAKSRRVRVRADNARFIEEYFLDHPCVDCGEPDRVVLEFDHVRGEKKYNVSEMVWSGISLKTIKSEIAKCEVRCANCHRRVTAKRREEKRNQSE